MTSSVLGIDVGGTKCVVTRFDTATWKRTAEQTFPTPAADGFAAVFDALLSVAGPLRDKGTGAVGVGLPGLVRWPSQQILRLPNIAGAENFPFRDRLSSALQLPVTVGNDSQCYTLAEALQGAAKGLPVVVGITLGTGVGGGIVIDGKIFRGSEGFAGELGHALLMPGKPPYETKDVRGDVEQFLSGTALSHRCTQAKRPEEYLKGQVCSFLRSDIFQEVAWTCATLTHTFNPSAIVFGGGFGRALGPFLADIEHLLRDWVLAGTPLPRLMIGTEKDVTLGAALLAMSAA